SIHVRLMRVADAATPLNADGAVGGSGGVVTMAVVLYAEQPSALQERTRYRYEKPGLRSVSVNSAVLGGRSAMSAYVPPGSTRRCRRNSVSSLLLSAQATSTVVEDVAVAAAPDGAFGVAVRMTGSVIHAEQKS